MSIADDLFSIATAIRAVVCFTKLKCEQKSLKALKTTNISQKLVEKRNAYSNVNVLKNKFTSSSFTNTYKLYTICIGFYVFVTIF